MSDITLSLALPFPPPPVAGARLGPGEGGEVADGVASAFEGLINLPKTVSVEGAVDAVCAPLAFPGLIAGILTPPAPVTPMTRTESTKMGAESTTVQIESVSKMAEMQLIKSSSASLDPSDPMPGPTDLESNVSPTSLTPTAQEAPDVPVQMAGVRAPATPSDAPALPYRPAANAGAVGGDQDAENVQPSVIPFASPAAAPPAAPAARHEPAPLRPAIGEPAALRARPAGFPAGVPFAQILSRPFRPVPVHPADALAAAAPETAAAPEFAETRAARSGDGTRALAPPGVLGGPPQAGASVAVAQIVGAGSAALPGPALAGEGESGPACAPLSDGSDAPLPAAAPLPRKLTERGAAAVLPADPASAPEPAADTGAGPTDAPSPAGAPILPHTGPSPPHIPGLPAAAPLPAAVPAQIVRAAADSGSPVTEIRLSPEELGSLRIELRTEGDRAFVTLSAERADTLDLLRRHSDRLAADFRAAGFAQVDLGFGHWSGPGQGAADQATPAPDGPMLPEAPPPDPAAWPSPVPPPACAGLYLRL